MDAEKRGGERNAGFGRAGDFDRLRSHAGARGSAVEERVGWCDGATCID